MRSFSSKYFQCGDGRLDSYTWCSGNPAIGEWYQLDDGVVGKIAGVAIKGRLDENQWVTTFKVMSKDVDGVWTDVEAGKVYMGNTESVRDTQVNVFFAAPVDARYIRIYPQTWYGWVSLRADIFAIDP